MGGDLIPSIASSPFQTLVDGYSADPTGSTIYSTAGTLNNGVLTQTGVAVLTTAVPEPASLGLLAGAVLGLVGRRRRPPAR